MIIKKRKPDVQEINTSLDLFIWIKWQEILLDVQKILDFKHYLYLNKI